VVCDVMDNERPIARPTTGELAVAVQEHGRRLNEAEDTISETRKTVTRTEQMLMIVHDKMNRVDARFAWTERLMYAAVIGIGGVIAQKIWELIMRPAP